MEDEELTLIPKRSVSEKLEENRTGRRPRDSFGLRCYDGGKTMILVVPVGYIEGDSDRADFYKSSKGFAIKISAEGERAISLRKSARTVNVPPEIKDLIKMENGTVALQCEDRGDRLYFFPFDQFAQ